MPIKIIDKIVAVEDTAPIFNSAAAALEFAVNIESETGIRRFAVNKDALPADFFNLRSGLAGEILQKLTNYGYKMAVYGDLTSYMSNALKAFILESNKCGNFYFVSDLDCAVKALEEIT